MPHKPDISPLSSVRDRWVIQLNTADIHPQRNHSNSAPLALHESGNSTGIHTLRMPQRWICCECDNGWTYRPGETNICQYVNCGHEKCSNCGVRTYDSLMGPALGTDLPVYGRSALRGRICSHRRSILFVDINQQHIDL